MSTTERLARMLFQRGDVVRSPFETWSTTTEEERERFRALARDTPRRIRESRGWQAADLLRRLEDAAYEARNFGCTEDELKAVAERASARSEQRRQMLAGVPARSFRFHQRGTPW